jgi:hypothetical protein
VLGNQTSTATSYVHHNGAADGLVGPGFGANMPHNIEHDLGIDNSYVDGNDEDCDYDEEDDDDEEDGNRDKSNKRLTTTFRQFIEPKIPVPQASQPQSVNNQQKSNGTNEQPRGHNQQARPHAAVEKRYRSIINSKIQQLNALIPALNNFNAVETNPPPEDQVVNATEKIPTKSVVLDRAIQYLNHLTSTYERYKAEHDELKGKLQLWLDDIPLPEVSGPEVDFHRVQDSRC